MIDRSVARGVRVVGVQDGYDSARKVHKLQAGLSGIIGEAFREMVKEKTYSALESRAKTGRPTGGRAYGYIAAQDGSTGRVTIDKERAPIVREIFERFAAGASCRTIAAELNARGIPCDPKAPPVHWFTKVAAGLGALMSAFDLLVGFARSADLHRSLKRRFIELEKRCFGEFDDEQMARERLTIEADEPPIYRALQLRCTRELAIAENIDPENYPAGYVTLPWYMRWTANWLHWPDAANVIPNQKRKGFLALATLPLT
jgi:hypothetical protein